MIEATLFFPLASVAVVLLGIPLWVALVRPNRFYGVRNAATLGDEAVWYSVNRAAGRDLVVVGGVSLFLSAFLPEWGLEGPGYVLLMAVVLAAGGGFVALISLARARRLRL